MVFFDLTDMDHSCVDFAKGNDWEGIKCPKVDGHQRAGKRTTVLTLKMVSAKIVDFSWTALADIVITDKTLEIFKRANLTGFRIEPVKIIPNKKLEKLGKVSLWEFLVTGSGGYSHPDSGVKLKSECKACGHRLFSAFENGIIVDEKKWDGSDFFTVIEYPKYILCTEKAKKVIEENQLSNVGFIPSHDLKWPEGVIKP